MHQDHAEDQLLKELGFLKTGTKLHAKKNKLTFTLNRCMSAYFNYSNVFLFFFDFFYIQEHIYKPHNYLP